MLKKTIAYLTSFYHSSNARILFSFFFIIAFLIRFPFFFRDYIDRDESTFILMGQSWVDGFLPYTELWDLKPPITFLFFAALIYTFGKSFLTIRIAGVLLVAITSLFTYKIGLSIANKKVAFWSGLLLVFLQSLFGSLQGVMSEHISMAFFIPALYLLIAKKRLISYLFAGILLGLSLMTKLNLAYPILFIFLFLFWNAVNNKEVLPHLVKILVLGGAILLVILATAAPYYLNNDFQLWWQSVFKAPMAYSGSKEHSIFNVLPFAIVIFGFFFWGTKKRLLDYKNPKILLLILTSLGILFSFMQAGKVNGHYLIQLYPTLVLLIAITAYELGFYKNLKYKSVVLFMLLLIPMESYLELKDVVQHKINKGSFYNGEGLTVPNYFREHKLSSDKVLFMEYHIGYWLLNEKPPTKAATHPSSILREELFLYMKNPRKTESEELQFILEDFRPNYIITRKNRRVFNKKKLAANFYINLQLLKNYTPLDTVDNAIIHQRLKFK
ncbi:glycosyltransferase family 39 protein [uncultured Croceitalea sp.]|uniref:ArnT family glycosyltransferase n=1 Tax=uncultured Croceitalea sp. TaxID=1798908 RepID=UPI0033066E63